MKEKTRILGEVMLFLVLVLGTSAGQPVSEISTGAVYTMTNDPTGNHVISYDRAADGTLVQSGNFATDGLGTGSSLGDQGGLVLSEDGKFLLVANAGSNEISAFSVSPKGLTLTDKVSSLGNQPVSITIHKNLVYVLNSGWIVGFTLDNNGKLSPIPNSLKPLSGTSVGPAEISFNSEGNILAVTEKTTNLIDTYTVDKLGVAHGPNIQKSNGNEPFGFAFDKRGNLIVSEAVSSTLSSYAVDNNGNLTTISKSVSDTQKAACWVAITKDGKFTYTNNAGSGTTSSYNDNKGTLTLLSPIAGSPGLGNIDVALSADSKFLYSLNSGGKINGFHVNADGSLSPGGTVVAPNGVEGLAAR